MYDALAYQPPSISALVIEKVDPVAALKLLSHGNGLLESDECGFASLLFSLTRIEIIRDMCHSTRNAWPALCKQLREERGRSDLRSRPTVGEKSQHGF